MMIPNPHGDATVVATLTEGNYFGEISLLKLADGCNRRNADVRSVGYSELLVLSKRDLIQVLSGGHLRIKCLRPDNLLITYLIPFMTLTLN